MGFAVPSEGDTRGWILNLIEGFLREFPPGTFSDRAFREARFDNGLAFIANAPGFGGLGIDASHQLFVDEHFAAVGANDWRDGNPIGLGIAAPTLYQHGTVEQKSLLRPLFSGEHIWCQLFSEPGAGSDLASVATRAELDGEEWVVNGQKVWTSLAHVADYGLLLARTDTSVPKHKGLTYFIVDMSLPGIEVRPLRQLTGEAEFNEVFLTNLRVHDVSRVGGVGEGWRIALTTLANERTSLGASIGDRNSGPIAQALDLWVSACGRNVADPESFTRLMSLWCRVEAVRLMTQQAAVARDRGAPGAEGSLAKLQMAELNQSIYDLCIDLMGIQGATYESYALAAPKTAGVHGSADVRHGFLRTMANSIEGGTSEVQRNIIGEQLLGLAPEPRVDKTKPFNELLLR